MIIPLFQGSFCRFSKPEPSLRSERLFNASKFSVQYQKEAVVAKGFFLGSKRVTCGHTDASNLENGAAANVSLFLRAFNVDPTGLVRLTLTVPVSVTFTDYS